MRTFQTVTRALPLCSLFFLMAAEDDCVIRILQDPEPDPTECSDVVCTLACENGLAIGDDGCAICACAPTCQFEGAIEPPECPEGSEPIFDEDACIFQCQPIQARCELMDCGPGFTCIDTERGGQCIPIDSQCSSDDECGAGFRCETACGADPGCPECDICLVVGTCVPNTTGCFSDVDCGPGFRCELSQNGGASPAFCDPADPNCGDIACREGDSACDPPQPPPADGVCVPADVTCFSDADCAGGFICEFFDPTTGRPSPPDECGPDGSNCLIAPMGICVPPPAPSCSTDADCQAGFVCETYTSCGGCEDICIVDEAGNVICDRPCDATCIEEGVCIPAPTGECRSDDDCAAGQVCQLESSCPCECMPGDDSCACPAIWCEPIDAGVCVDLEPLPCPALCGPGSECVIGEDGSIGCAPLPTLCSSSDDCQVGEICNAGDICLPPPGCDNGENCITLCYGYCVDSAQPPSDTCDANGACPDGARCLDGRCIR